MDAITIMVNVYMRSANMLQMVYSGERIMTHGPLVMIRNGSICFTRKGVGIFRVNMAISLDMN